ncbi:MAG: bifunctional enoyl-CoA hydratase/phosphate acetyltransferase [Bacteroidales bacterium]|nr:bifunctional enoyl-CoA hydratase/phosphate acetyltransferase [Bacteroidales bacterium]
MRHKMVRHLDELVEIAKSKRTRKLVLAAAGDEDAMLAVKNATENGIIEPILIGDMQKITAIAKRIDFDISKFETYNEEDKVAASTRACIMIKEGKAGILMKGAVGTGTLMKAVLNKEDGLRSGDTLSHMAVFESPYYHKLLGVTDAAMNVSPDLETKIAIIKNAVEVFHKLDCPNPKVAIVGSVETVNPRMEATMHAATISMMNYRKQIRGCIIDGPLAIDNAVSRKSAELKDITSDVAGDTDIIIAPDIDSGNILYKTLNFLGGAVSAAVIMGAMAPIVLTSRSDSDRSKFLSIALAANIG